MLFVLPVGGFRQRLLETFFMPFSMKQVLSGPEILVGVLEEALKAGADSIRLEYEDTGLGVNFFNGQLGSLVGIVPRDREQDLLASLIEKAGMLTKAHGEITIQLHGREHVIDVKEFDSFGESAYLLSFRKRRHLSGRKD